MYYAHIKEDSRQTLKEHLENVAKISADFANDFNAKDIGYICGLLHDIGKYSIEFQRRLEGSELKVDHSTAGSQEVCKLYDKAFGKIMAYIISGHHAGLPDSGSENRTQSLAKRLKKIVNDYSDYKNEIIPPELPRNPVRLDHSFNKHFSAYFFIKMLYSCLVDADFLDTEKFMDADKFKLRNQHGDSGSIYRSFVEYMSKILKKEGNSRINQNRNIIYDKCIREACNPTGMFSLSVPTGGGKTLSSMAFALEHAKINKLKRIIYVIPYTSIIEQNAQIYREIFSEENILEHHCNFQFDEVFSDETSLKRKLASENWDIPIIATTNVQFFESIFSNKSSMSRKLHNLSRSVIILDEAQMIPVQYLKLCVGALCEIAVNYSSTIVLCTATQPNIQSTDFFPKSLEIKEIMEKPEKLYEEFRRVNIKKLGETDDSRLIEMLKRHKQVLCIVNRRRHAELLFNMISDEKNIYHLSTRMCAAHRKRTIRTIKDHLSRGEECKVISTQLIEAGVDIDFPVVYRAMAGLDSIVQAAGRCNREGKRPIGDVYVFSPTEKHAQPPKEIKINVSEAESVFRSFDDPISIDAINRYFELLYNLKNTDSKKLSEKIKNTAKTLDFPFAEISDEFKIIENNTVSVIVPYDERAKEIIDELIFSDYPLTALRKIQPYTVSLYEHEFNQINSSGGIKSIGNKDPLFCISDMDLFYCDSTGIILDHENLKNDFFMF